jgi:hypothetical protein
VGSQISKKLLSVIFLINITLIICCEGLDVLFISDNNNFDFDDWDDSVDISIDGDTLSLTGDVSDFPLLVRLDDTNFPDIETSKVKSGGADIRFTNNNGTPLSYEIENWSDNTSGTIWVLVDTISSTTQTTIRMYYNNPGAVSESSPNAVFSTSNGFLAVYHMSNAPSGGPDSIKDSTGNLNHGTPQNGMDGTDLVTANMGEGLDFDGDDEYITASHISAIDGSSFSISAWSKRNDTDEPRYIAGQGTVNNNYKSFHFGYRGTNYFTFSFYADDLNSNSLYTNTSDFEYWAGTYNMADDVRISYKDGAYENDDIGGTMDTSGNFEIGRRSGGVGDDYWYGIIDELRIESAVRSANWIKLSYETQKSSQTIVNIL